ncbi:nucleotide-binding universal stress UspA family protein [Maritalea mobilis]|uniref:Universal stress protein n=1 Tax=Maritalea mobilis TaxID=483324 RepID=A0A4V3DBM6_9HYPH|nr:universal stress protein [Maritalea mobilis]TDQ67138.1 nucleotide-binding universal stress UspA family protein [Maritalea mobilis]
MSKSVLCAVDINRPKDEKHILEEAYRLAKLDDARLDVITVVPDYGMSVVGSYFDADHTKKVKEAAHHHLIEVTESVVGAEANKNVRHIVSVGNAYEEILRTAEKAGSDLIVIGAHKPDFRDFLLGPNAARVVRHSTCSVYVVR